MDHRHGRFEKDLRQRHEAEMQRLKKEEEQVLDIEREALEARMKQKKVRAAIKHPSSIACCRCHPFIAVACMQKQHEKVIHKSGHYIRTDISTVAHTGLVAGIPTYVQSRAAHAGR